MTEFVRASNETVKELELDSEEIIPYIDYSVERIEYHNEIK